MRNRLIMLLATFLTSLLTGFSVLAQSSSESVYSDQAFDPVDHPEWYETPLLWIGLVLFGGAIVYVLVRGRRA